MAAWIVATSTPTYNAKDTTIPEKEKVLHLSFGMWNGFWKLYLHVGPVLFAPDVSYPDPEKLFGRQVQTRKTLLITIVTDPLG